MNGKRNGNKGRTYDERKVRDTHVKITKKEVTKE
jgi:hypothetical protein